MADNFQTDLNLIIFVASDTIATKVPPIKLSEAEGLIRTAKTVCGSWASAK